MEELLLEECADVDVDSELELGAGEGPLGILGVLDKRLAVGLLRLSTEGRPATDEAVEVLVFALRHGIRILDTADVYGLDQKDLHYGERLAAEAVRKWAGPPEQVRILTKAGLARRKARWIPNGRPEQLRESVDGSLQALQRDRLFLLLLHARDPRVPFEETLEALAELRSEGKVEHLGLCNVNAFEIAQAERHFPVTAVQNELSLLNRKTATEGIVEATRDQAIPLLAHRPLGGHAKKDRLGKNRILQPLAERHSATPWELALAALLDAGDHIVPVVGATRIGSVQSSLRALDLKLDVSDRAALAVRYSFDSDAGKVTTFPRPDCSGLPALAPDAPPGESDEVVVLMGIQGAGKSERVASYVSAGYDQLNRDLVGRSLNDLIPRLDQLLTNGQRRVVLDNTYPTRSSRAPVIAVAHQHQLPVRCVFLKTPPEEARINVVLRMLDRYGMPLGPDEMKAFRKADPNLPPPMAMKQWIDSFEPPSLDEGFSVIDEVPFTRRVDSTHTRPGLFLDVDGTIRRTLSGEKYPRHPDDLELLPGRRQVLQRWIDDGYQLFLLSNQSGVASGKISHDIVQACLHRTVELLQLPVTEMVYCPHPAFPVGCYCRKPLPGLGVYLMQRHKLDRNQLCMVGDLDSDAQFAKGMGIKYHHADEFFG